MRKAENPVWRFFASVKLALITLIILAATSIIGTLVKQGKAPTYYVEEYGPKLSRLFEMLDITNMYSSWWFVALLSLFALNLVVCSIERLPGVWRMVVLDNLATDPEKLEKMSSTRRADASMPVGAAADRMLQVLVGAGWKNSRRQDLEGSSLLFVQRGAWTRLGVYVVHVSILVILAGAMIGSFFGVKAFVFLPEGRSTRNIFLQGSREPVPLGFELQCDRFDRALYPNGMVREYRADLTVIDPEREAPYKKSIIVNDPLTYEGITFYQADSFPLEEYFVVIHNRNTGLEQAFRVPPDRDVAWQGTDISFRIEELKRDQNDSVSQARIRFAASATAEPSVFWMENNSTVTIGRPGEDFTFSFRQLYSTLLLANKDPGVFLVYLGCILMVVGLAVSLFLSHWRIWIHITPRGKQGARVLVSGASNKNKPAFERRFQELARRIEQGLVTSNSKQNP